MTRVPLGPTVLLTALVLVVAGCGGQPFPEGAASPSSTAPAATAQSLRTRLLASVQRASSEKTARVAMTMTVTGQEAIAVTGTGVVDIAGGQMSMSLRGTANGEPVSLDARLVDNLVYVRTERDWLSSPVDQEDELTPNPASYLEYLQGVSDDVHEVGPAVLRGEDMTQYSAGIDLNLALAHARSRDERSVFAHALDLFGSVKMPAKVWIDADGRLRKLQVELDIAPALRRAGETVSGNPTVVVTTEFYDFGVPVHVEAPTGAIDQVAAAQYRVAESDLRNALTTEKVYYTDNLRYSSDPVAMKQIEPSLDWGGKLAVVVGNRTSVADAVVCMSEKSGAGPVFTLADVASGPHAGTYYARRPCPAVVDELSVSGLGSSW